MVLPPLKKFYAMYLSKLKNLGCKINLKKSVSLSDRKKIFFIKRLAFLIQSGMPVLESLQVMLHQAEKEGDRTIYQSIINNLENGKSLSDSLRALHPAFGILTVNIIHSGEISGNLGVNLDYLCVELRKRYLLKKKIISALIYPAIISIATLGIVVFLTTYIFPKIVPIFNTVRSELPATTKIVIFISENISNYGLEFFVFLVILFFGYKLIKIKFDKISYFEDSINLKIWPVREIVQNYNLANISRTLGLLLRSGMSLNESMLVTSSTTLNSLYREALINLNNQTNQGKTIAHSMKAHSDLFPQILRNLIATGEKSGNLPNTLQYLSEYYENELEDQTRNISSLLEPVMMIIMGTLVGFLAISIITPIYELTNQFNG